MRASLRIVLLAAALGIPAMAPVPVEAQTRVPSVTAGVNTSGPSTASHTSAAAGRPATTPAVRTTKAARPG